MTKTWIAAVLLAGGVALVSARGARAEDAPVTVVPKVDLQRYTGVWYEIASFPQRFQKGCTNTTATYGIRDDGDVSVKNRCWRDGEWSGITGKAWVADEETNAKLKVRFFWPFCGDYWIIALGENYDYAMVGAPDREYLWILARQPTLDQAVYDDLVAQAKAQGFPVEKLRRTLHDRPQTED